MKYAIAFLTIFFTAAVPAQKQPAPAPTPAPAKGAAAPDAAPISMTDPDGQDLILEDLSARAAVQGMLSLTELELRFRNPRPRRIEGRFTCTLPANAAISRFAKEVNGQLMEGEVVERLRANQVYEQFLHQMRDPALLEQEQGNRFSARIFPIEANATVRIVLSYTTLLPLRGGQRTFALPLRGTAKMKHFRFRAIGTALPGEETGGVMAKSTADVWSMEESDYTPDHDIEISWRPTADASRARLLRSGDFYLAAFRPPLQRTDSDPNTNGRWLFYVDTSASAAEGAEHRIRALEQLFAALPRRDTVQVRAFDQEIVTLANGPASEVSRNIGSLLRARLFLGGTDLGAVLRDIASAKPNETVVVASDLVPTLGTTDRKELNDQLKALPRLTVHALILGPREDAQLARALTANMRGRIVRLPFSEQLDQRAAEAAAALRHELGVSFDVVDSGAEWVYPSHFDDVQEGDEVIVIGKVKPAAQPAVHLTGAAATQLQISSLPAGTFAPLLEREGYRAYLDYLAEREANEPSEAVRKALATEQVRVSVEQRVVIPRTTMLVLETEWDYQRFGLDRRALASILTIDAGGITTIDRRGESVAALPPPRPRQMPVLAPENELRKSAVMGNAAGGARADAPAGQVLSSEAPVDLDAVSAGAEKDVQARMEGGVEGGVVGGVAGGVVGGAVREQVAAAPPPPRPRLQAPTPTIPIESAPVVAPPEPKRDASWTKMVKPDQARIDELQAKLRQSPRDRELYNQLSEALAVNEDWSALRKLALQWQPFDPENPQVYELLGLADEHLGRESEAARANASIIEVAPGKTELLQRAGLLLVRNKRAKLAETPLRRALELRPDRVNSYRHLALMLWLDGRPEEAAGVLEAATRQKFPDWYRDAQRVVREELGYVYRAWGAKDPAARAEIERRAAEYEVDLDRRDALRVTLAWETDANDV
ncbi:MAG TPA: VIT domain-containing protein, partial [Thermoanaerobaculia bacterium]|nr:VIT domain-containing protein [Thermoanaerobaculia bacterium]